MATREAFLDRVRDEVAKVRRASERPADPARPAATGRDAGGDWEQWLRRFRHEAERVGTVCHRAATIEDAAEIVLGLAQARKVRRVATWGRSRLGRAVDVATRLGQAGLEVLEASPEDLPEDVRGRMRGLLAQSEIGLTTADLAVAETGSLVLASGPGKGRGVSLLPSCHVAVFGREALVPDLEEAGAVLAAWHATVPRDAGANVVFITGPSRTADIELTLTRGVHGPKEVHAVFVESL